MSTHHSMSARDAVTILRLAQTRGVDVCVGGGWAVDALVKEQTREHGDLDLWAPAAHLEPLFVALAEAGVDRIFPWPGDRPWNFVLHDGASRRVDLHLYEQLPAGDLHYGSVAGGHVFPLEALSGLGVIDGHAVRCESPEWALRWHAGYPPRAVDHHDIALLCERFGLH